ncbi:MAG: HPr family phosphocarrier protein [Elusimicrobia bacterium]|nr:HPr family phosphocarrier protein [Elusimicrobiota bacterium]
MVTKTITVSTRLGLHARPAAMFVQEASRFKSKIVVCKEGVEVNGKSVMGIMLLAAEHGARVTLTATGPDEAEALKALERLFQRKFDEE